jgi:hypothetical protein
MYQQIPPNFLMKKPLAAPSLPPQSTMLSGHPVSEDLAWTIIRMLSILPLSHISAYSGLSICKIKAIRVLYRQTGEVTNDLVSWKGRRVLWSRDINVSKDKSYAQVSYT